MQVLKYIFTLTLIFIYTHTSNADDWTRWRGPNANGISVEKGWDPASLSSPDKLWEINVGAGHSSITVRDKYLYTMGNIDSKDIVYCLDAISGKEYWRFAYDSPAGNYGGPRGTPTIDGEYVYTISREGHVHCLEASTGKLIWEKNLAEEYGAESPRWGFATSPYILNDMLLLNVNKHGVALNKKTGKKIWTSEAQISGYATPSIIVLEGKTYGLFFGENELYGVDLSSGKEVWSYPWKTEYEVNATDPMIIDNQLFITSGYKSGCALLSFKGNKPELVWKNKNMSNHFGGAVYHDGHLYGSSGLVGKSRSKLNCLNLKTGDLVWSEKLGFNSVTLADKKLLVLTEKGKLLVAEASPTGLKEISSAQVLPKSVRCWTAPVLSNGKIYCRNTEGDIVCLNVKK